MVFTVWAEATQCVACCGIDSGLFSSLRIGWLVQHGSTLRPRKDSEMPAYVFDLASNAKNHGVDTRYDHDETESKSKHSTIQMRQGGSTIGDFYKKRI